MRRIRSGCDPVRRMAMKAVLMIATAKADFRTRSCPLYPQKRTCAVQIPMSALGRYCCKSPCRAAQYGKTGKNRIRRTSFLNQYSPLPLNREKTFFAPGLKIFLQQYRPEADSCSAAKRYLLDHLVGYLLEIHRHVEAKRICCL